MEALLSPIYNFVQFQQVVLFYTLLRRYFQKTFHLSSRISDSDILYSNSITRSLFTLCNGLLWTKPVGTGQKTLKFLKTQTSFCCRPARCKSCMFDFNTIPAEDVEQRVVDEVLGILRSPEIVMNVERIAEREAHSRDTKHSENAVREGKHSSIAAEPGITKQNLILALRNLTEVWSFLYSTEQQKIVGMLTDEVVIGDDVIKITMDLGSRDAGVYGGINNK